MLFSALGGTLIHLVPFYVPVMIRKDLRVQEWCPFDHKIGLDNHFSVIFVTICDHFWPH